MNKDTDNILLQQMKWPIETLYVGLRPSVNTDVASPTMLYGWDQYSYLQQRTVSLCCLQNGWYWDPALPAGPGITAAQYTANFRAYTGLTIDFAAALTALGYVGIVAGTVLTVDQLNVALGANGFEPMSLGTPAAPIFPTPATPTAVQLNAAVPSTQCQATYVDAEDTMSLINIEAHGIPLYRDFPTKFFNAYIPYVFGGTHINTPDDVGVHMITWNLYPGSYQPSGHVNISRAREFYLRYASTQVGSLVPNADLIVVGIAINFLLVSDGSAVLRYST